MLLSYKAVHSECNRFSFVWSCVNQFSRTVSWDMFMITVRIKARLEITLALCAVGLSVMMCGKDRLEVANVHHCIQLCILKNEQKPNYIL